MPNSNNNYCSAVVTFDPFASAFLADPHRTLADLRRDQPVCFHDGLDVWLVSRHEHIRTALLDHATFRPINALDAVTAPSFSTLRVLASAGFRLPATLANNDGANHLELRRIATRFIGPSRLNDARPIITKAANDAIEEALSYLDHDPCDLVALVARQVPCRVILSLLDIDLDIATFINWSNAALELFWGRPSDERQQLLATYVAEFHRFLGDLVDSLSGNEAGMAAALVQADAFTRDEIIGACFFTLIAGQETTTQLLSTSLHWLLREPSRWASLCNDPNTALAWVDEMLRREPPISSWRRVTSKATKLGGVDIPENASVLLLLTSAGSDAEVFTDPAELCPYRPNVREHLAFGLGRHKCPGADLARTEAEITLRIAAERLPALRLLEEQPPMLELLSFRSPTRVLVERPDSEPVVVSINN